VIGDGENYQAWTVDVKARGGVVTTWPFGWNGTNSGPYTGAPAARFDVATFQQLLAAGIIGASDPSGMTANGQYVYVLPPASVVDSAPSDQNMSTMDQVENFLFSDWGDALAAFPGQLANELKGTVGYASNLVGTVGSAVTSAAATTIRPLLVPLLAVGGVLVLVLAVRARGRA
jgi:hypothetical protein